MKVRKIREGALKEKNYFSYALLTFLVGYMTYIYSSFSLITGIQYTENSLEIFYLIISVLVALFYLKNIYTKKITKYELIVLYLVLLIICGFLVSHAIYGFHNGAFTTFKLFLVRSVPAIIVGIILAKDKAIGHVIAFTDIYILFTTLALLTILLNGLLPGVSRTEVFSIFGMSAQSISYMAVYAFGLNSYMILYGKDHIKKSIFNNRIYNYIRISLIPLQLITVFFGGGRGAFILLIVFSIYLLFFAISSEIKVGKFIKRIFLVSSLITVAILFLSNFFPNLFNQSFERMTGFISSGTINWDQTSGRDDVYFKIFDLIFSSPIIGYGIAGAMYKENLTAHNFFLEVMVEGGLIYLTLWIIILYKFLTKLLYLIKIDSKYHLVMIMFLSEFINMQFSAVYLRTTIFWFCLVFVFCVHYSYKKHELVSLKKV
ncbi:O-antigen ligase family protein [Sutcliffiella horikoshii]|nr:O-antigen ligase family protein [Sutcliffiella horikoshii]